MSYSLLYWPHRGFIQRTTRAVRWAMSFPCIPKLRMASAFLYLVSCQTGLSQAFDDRLHRAAWEGDLAALESLLNEGANASARDKDDWTPLHYAKTASVAGKLLEAGADMWALDSGDNTPLHFALTEGVVDELIKAWRANSLSADPEWDYPNWQNAFGRTPLHTAKTAEVAMFARAEKKLAKKLRRKGREDRARAVERRIEHRGKLLRNERGTK